eukprot:CAMPEP_0118714686 /NCGR_PEP_ID=MMETSP0800-20121206/26356_1 /TAXON_ID=210618 ORGANISM="Striatella unipunctata, Strain CCMP2910" /NCGR_SAMPLE_ID=MMETSP0800 /ASSEMBLY_ACC=CAM_ASM_000638 /LENGTH=297 /DNA_ID=CAMNT_0006620569 /DNA_START=308 /DNA_END=1201 /DNA_ORIENTATION=-
MRKYNQMVRENEVSAKRTKLSTTTTTTTTSNTKGQDTTMSKPQVSAAAVAVKKNQSPFDFVLDIIRKHNKDVDDSKIMPASLSLDIFELPTEEQIAAYDHDVVGAVQTQDLEKLRELLSIDPLYLQCCNRFGESLLHMACRRGFKNVVKLLMEEANVTVYKCDDYGRTPMHDACWASVPQYEVMEMLLEKAPELLLLKDARGFTPFSYVRKDHWEGWIKFLSTRTHLLLQWKPPGSSSTTTTTSFSDYSETDDDYDDDDYDDYNDAVVVDDDDNAAANDNKATGVAVVAVVASVLTK